MHILLVEMELLAIFLCPVLLAHCHIGVLALPSVYIYLHNFFFNVVNIFVCCVVQ